MVACEPRGNLDERILLEKENVLMKVEACNKAT